MQVFKFIDPQDCLATVWWGSANSIHRLQVKEMLTYSYQIKNPQSKSIQIISHLIYIWCKTFAI